MRMRVWCGRSEGSRRSCAQCIYMYLYIYSYVCRIDADACVVRQERRIEMLIKMGPDKDLIVGLLYTNLRK